jgi:Mechanosensitive ion channel
VHGVDRVPRRVSGAIITATEMCMLVAALVIILSMIGVNVNALLIPAGVALAIAAKDLSHNFLAGFFLFAVQPFKMGDRVAVSYSTPAVAGNGPSSSWFEGVCDKVDLRWASAPPPDLRASCKKEMHFRIAFAHSCRDCVPGNGVQADLHLLA